MILRSILFLIEIIASITACPRTDVFKVRVFSVIEPWSVEIFKLHHSFDGSGLTYPNCEGLVRDGTLSEEQTLQVVDYLDGPEGNCKGDQVTVEGFAFWTKEFWNQTTNQLHLTRPSEHSFWGSPDEMKQVTFNMKRGEVLLGVLQGLEGACMQNGTSGQGARWKLDIPIELIRDPFKQSEDHQLNDEAERFDTDVTQDLPDPFMPCTSCALTKPVIEDSKGAIRDATFPDQYRVCNDICFEFTIKEIKFDDDLRNLRLEKVDRETGKLLTNPKTCRPYAK